MSRVQIVEVGLRDGLQNEKERLSTQIKFETAQRLVAAGLKRIELGAFVSPKWVPQMADTAELLQLFLKWKPEARKSISVLVPNKYGMEQALVSKVSEVAIFASCSESFSQKNINCSIEESFHRFSEVVRLAKKNKMKVRGYLSVCFGCPFEGNVPEKQVFKLIEKMLKLGCFEVSIGDTIGKAHAKQIQRFFKNAERHFPIKKLAGHFHNTRGQALANIYAAFEEGIRVFDTSIAGLGGCPYAPGSTGNVATEDVIYMLNGMGVNTGIDLNQLISTSHWLSQRMKRRLYSSVSNSELIIK